MKKLAIIWVVGFCFLHQKSFAQIRAEYETKLAENKEEESATSQRKPLLGLINQRLIPYLNTMSFVDSQKYSLFVRKADEIIESVNTVVKARSKKKEEKTIAT